MIPRLYHSCIEVMFGVQTHLRHEPLLLQLSVAHNPPPYVGEHVYCSALSYITARHVSLGVVLPQVFPL
jgi:hypothetical protein